LAATNLSLDGIPMATIKVIKTTHYELDLDGHRIGEITSEECRRRRGKDCVIVADCVIFPGGSLTKRTDPSQAPLTIYRDEQIHVVPDFETCEALKEALDAGETVTIHRPSGPLENARMVTIEGPYGPVFRKWYAEVHISDGKIKKITRNYPEGS